MSSSSSHVWHHRIHQRWGGEDLFFWRLAFFPTYDLERIRHSIAAVLAEGGVHSYAIYETMGLFDLFVRAWLPSRSSERVEQALREVLQPESLQLLDSFSVSRVLRHHAWEDSGGEIEPSEQVLVTPADDHEIERLNKGHLAPGEEQRLFGQGIMAPRRPGEGITFLTIVSSAVFSVASDAEETLRQGLLELLREPRLREPSLYEGSGFGQYVVMGKAASDDFFAITQLFTAFNKLVVHKGVSARPYTHVSAHLEPLEYRDVLPLRGARRSSGVDALLSRGEPGPVEVIGSLGRDVNHWLGDASAEELPPERVIADGLIKTVVGMLNAEGGHVVLGAVRRDALFGDRRADDHPKLRGRQPYGDYVCIGVEDEYGDGGWEGFRSRINELMAEKIQPSPAGSVSVTRETVDGLDIWVVGVQPTRATWFYRVLSEVGPVTFFVRDGDATVAYAGIQADAYKRQRPRG